MEERASSSPGGTIILPMVPLRDIVVFPHTMVPFVVGRKPSLMAVERAQAMGKKLFLSTQRNAKVDQPTSDQINAIGTISTIVQHLKLPNGNVKLLVEGGARARVLEIEEDPEGFFQVVLEEIGDSAETAPEVRDLMTRVSNLFERYIKYSPGLPYETMLSTVRISEPGQLADTISAHLPASVDEKQALLETISAADRLEEVSRLLTLEIEKLRVDKKIQNRVKKQMEKAQKEYYLNEKMKAIQQELGRKDDKVNEVEELREKIESAKMPKEAKDRHVAVRTGRSYACPVLVVHTVSPLGLNVLAHRVTSIGAEVLGAGHCNDGVESGPGYDTAEEHEESA